MRNRRLRAGWSVTRLQRLMRVTVVTVEHWQSNRGDGFVTVIPRNRRGGHVTDPSAESIPTARWRRGGSRGGGGMIFGFEEGLRLVGALAGSCVHKAASGPRAVRSPLIVILCEECMRCGLFRGMPVDSGIFPHKTCKGDTISSDHGTFC